MTFDPVSLVAGILTGLIFAGLIALWKITALKKDLAHERQGRAEMGDLFSLTAQQALDKTSEQFLQRFGALAQEKMTQAKADSAHDLDKRQIAINELVMPIRKQLETLGSTVEQIKGTDKALREDLQTLGRETARLVGALKDPSAQGHWGEFILEGLLDKSGLIKGVHYETQVSIQSDNGRQRPDAIIRLHDGFHIVVDAKAPLNQFADRLGENLSAEDTKQLMQNLARQGREHVRVLGKKGYWENLDSPDFTVMFLPSEHLFSIAIRADPDIIDFAHDNNIVIASPTLMMSLLRVVGLSWRQVALAQNAEEISTQGMELYKRLSKFGEHLEKVGKSIGSAMGSYNDAVGSLQRMVMPAARKLKELQSKNSDKDMPELAPLEDPAPRRLELSSFDEEDTNSPEELPVRKVGSV
ncbi:MAG: DNA recombination protein RmuC [Alphaproteobacteria bacterium CG_4_9_14_3_um_filter_47_13]|nr:MAG: DNA recombination protein RmuC [Alphaproteobacteria bacterium CG_4_9_14_3_um_filter_47_13]